MFTVSAEGRTRHVMHLNEPLWRRWEEGGLTLNESQTIARHLAENCATCHAFLRSLDDEAFTKGLDTVITNFVEETSQASHDNNSPDWKALFTSVRVGG